MKQRVAPNLHDSHSNDAYNAGDDAIMPHAMRRPDQHRHIEEERADEEGNGDHEPDEHDDDRCSAHKCLQPAHAGRTVNCLLRTAAVDRLGRRYLTIVLGEMAENPGFPDNLYADVQLDPTHDRRLSILTRFTTWPWGA